MSWPFIAALGISYLIGSLPTGYLLVKLLAGKDVRTVGSGNVGATNVMRAAGRGAGAAVFLMDMAKGVVAVLLIGPWLVQPRMLPVQLACGLAAIVGHNFPIFLKFHGGKGVATTVGVLCAAMPLIGVAYLLVWGLCFMAWHYVSVASLAAAATIPLGQLLAHQAPSALGIGGMMALLMVLRHRENIQRLRQGTEPRSR